MYEGVFDHFFEDKGESDFADHVGGKVEVKDFGGGDETFDGVHTVLADGVVGEVDGVEPG